MMLIIDSKESLSRIYGQYEKQSCKAFYLFNIPYDKNKYENLSAIFNLFTLVGMNAFHISITTIKI